MTRLKPLALNKIDKTLADLLPQVANAMGFMPNDALVMARKPDITTAFAGLVAAVQGPGELPADLKRLLALASSQQADCQYCISHTKFSALRSGIDKAKVAALANWQNSHLFSEAEKAALNVAKRASEIPNAVRDEDFNQMKKHFSETAITELIAVVALFGFLNRWNSTLKTEVEASCQLL